MPPRRADSPALFSEQHSERKGKVNTTEGKGGGGRGRDPRHFSNFQGKSEQKVARMLIQVPFLLQRAGREEGGIEGAYTYPESFMDKTDFGNEGWWYT